MEAAVRSEAGFHNHPRLVNAQHKFSGYRQASLEAAQEFLLALGKARAELRRGVKKASRELTKGIDLSVKKFME